MKRIVLSFVSLMMLAFFVICTLRSQSVVTTDWDLMPLPQLPQLGERPVVPFGDSLPSAFQERLRVLVEGHPHSDVSRVLNGVLASGELPFEVYAHPNILLKFGLYPKHFLAGYEGPMVVPGWVSVLTMHPEFLERLESPDQVLRAMLGLYHETNHYQQWLRNPTEPSFRATPPGEVVTTTECRSIWHNESEAYATECQLAISWGVPQLVLDELCQRSVQPEAFRQYLFYILVEQVPACAEVFADLAGHPHPEAFK